MASTQCPACRKRVFSWEVHRCAPAWDAWIADDGPDGSRTVHAVDAEEAAKEFVERRASDDQDYPDDGEELEVCVRPLADGGAPRHFRVRCVMVPTYFAEELPQDEEDATCEAEASASVPA